MARRPTKYIITLSEGERTELEQLVRSGTTERRHADRARMVLWADEGITLDRSAERLGCHRETVIYWRRAFLERRAEGIPACLADQPRSGRPRSFSPGAGNAGQGDGL